MAKLNIEQEFISAVLDEKISISDILKTSFEANWLSQLADVWEWIVEYQKQNKSLPSHDLVISAYPLYEKQEIKNNPMSVLDAIEKGSRFDRLYTALQRGTNLLMKQGSPEKSLEYLTEQIKKFNVQINKDKDIFDLTDTDVFERIYKDYLARYEARMNKGQVGIPSGLGQQFDDWLGGGFTKGLMYGMVGYTGVGKSWMRQIIGKSAMVRGYRVLDISLEGVLETEFYRFMSIATGISNDKLMRGFLPPEEFRHHFEQIQQMVKAGASNYMLGIHGKRPLYTPDVLRQKIAETSPDMIIVDYTTMMGIEGVNKNWEMFLDISRQLKIIGMAEDIPMLALLQTDMMAFGKDEITNVDIAQSKGMSRDFDYLWGVNKVKGKEYTIRLNSFKQRFSKDAFDGFFRTNWDEGKVEYIGPVNSVTGDAHGDF